MPKGMIECKWQQGSEGKGCGGDCLGEAVGKECSELCSQRGQDWDREGGAGTHVPQGGILTVTVHAT